MGRHDAARATRAGLLVTVLALALAVAAGCGAGASSNPQPVRLSGSLSVPRAKPRAVTKLLVVVMENHSLSQMRAQMPYTFALAKRFGYATRYHALVHPSLPNYLAIAGGSTFGVRDDNAPADHRLRAHTVFGQALARGRTAGVFAESMPSRCDLQPSDPYAVKHNPWAYFVPERQACKAHDRPYSVFRGAVAKGRLPNAGLVVPNLCHDAHDCDLSSADAFFRRVMTTVFAGPDWRSGHLAVVLTADEDDHNQGNKVLTVVVHPSQRHHVVRTRLNHYSLTRLYDDVLGAPYLRHAASAPSMTRAFGLPVR